MNQPQPNWFAVITALQSSARHELHNVDVEADPTGASRNITIATLLLHMADALRAGLQERRPVPGDLIDAS